MSGFLLDTGIISAVRVSGLPASEWVGSPDLAVSITAVEEVFEDLPADDPKAIGNVLVLAGLPTPIAVSDEILDLSRRLVAAYAEHSRPLAINDAVIAATAILGDLTLVTKNRNDFHYIEGLSWIDANGVTPALAPLLQVRAAVRGALSPRSCCDRLRPPRRTGA